jgi:hypothetical protein
MDLQGVSLSTTSSMNMQGVPLFHQQQCEHAGCIPVYRLYC